MTIVFTDEARSEMEGYLRRVRSTLSRQLSVDVSDVERDIMSHIDEELTHEAQPVGAQRLRSVLERLGAPDRWLPVDDVPQVERAVDRLIPGPAWAIPSAVLALFLLGILLFMRMILWPLPILLMLVSILLARVWLVTQRAELEDAGPRRWFVYPPLAAIYVPLGAALFVWPLSLIAGALSDDVAMQARMLEWFPRGATFAAPMLAAAVLGVWWLLLGAILYRRHRLVQVTFKPFADWFGARYALLLSCAGLALAAVSAAALFRMMA